MRAYAVLSGNPLDNVALASTGYPWVLQSFYAQANVRSVEGVPLADSAIVRQSGNVEVAGVHVATVKRAKVAMETVVDEVYRPRGMLIDSGAYSAWTLGAKIDLHELVAFAREMQAVFGEEETRLINLDVIPGQKGLPATMREVEAAAKAGARNAEKIRGEGLPVIEVYHGREPVKYLRAILKRRQPGELIALGGMGGLPMPVKRTVAALTMKEVLKFCGDPGAMVPVHLLGASADAPLASKYPWFSVDATSWFTARNYNNHVTRSGRFVVRNKDTAPRTTHDMTQVFLRRKLDSWARAERTLTKLWAERGFAFDLEGGA